MLFKQDVLARMATGEVTLAFRRWRRPSVRAGGTLLTPIGQLSIRSVQQVDFADVTARDAKRAGYESLDALRGDLAKARAGELYRIEFRRIGDDPRVALRDRKAIAPGELAELVERLARLDRAAIGGPWTRPILELIAAHPEQRAAELAAASGYTKEWLKLNVRKLKNLGLTESLNPGYRLSPRGKALLKRLK